MVMRFRLSYGDGTVMIKALIRREREECVRRQWFASQADNPHQESNWLAPCSGASLLSELREINF